MTTPETIPEAAVTAAAEALEARAENDDWEWCLGDAIAALSAAAPLLQAQALRDAEVVVDAELQDAPPSNYEEDNYDAGYIAGLTYAQDLLRARADQLEGKTE